MSNFMNEIEDNKGKKAVFLFTLVLFSILGSLITLHGTGLFVSLPGFFVALLLGPIEGAIVGGLGFFASTLVNGAFSDVLINILMMIGIAILIYVFGYLHRRINIIVNIFIITLLNGPVLSFVYLISYDWTYYKAVVFTLTLIAAINVVLAYIIYYYYENKNR